MPLQRALQKGRYAFWGLYKLGPAQVGHFTCLGLTKGSLISRFLVSLHLGAEGHFKRCVVFAGNEFAIGLLVHEANDHQQTVATDLGCEVQAIVHAQTEQLKVATMR